MKERSRQRAASVSELFGEAVEQLTRAPGACDQGGMRTVACRATKHVIHD